MQRETSVQTELCSDEEKKSEVLARKLEEVKKEKATLLAEVEQEEEFMTNTLQKRLKKLLGEKADSELKVMELKKQTERLAAEKAKLCSEKIELEAVLESESEYIVNKLHAQIEKAGSDKGKLFKEKTDLQRQVGDLAQAVDKLNREKVKLEQEMEAEEESIVNRLQRQLEGLLHNLRVIEQKLGAKGLTFEDLGISPSELSMTETTQIYARTPSASSGLFRMSSDMRSSSELRGSRGL
uniref:Uncharacterized protein n=1 Tax=Dunaliella tertiolecta TaxID=3047 RepID=A0A7S3QM22_DUNTE|mmetsp:Transcript_27266/g.73689  ORF Transcript_27266/g.73689 Transcript_27266/m.73689 type:complete len:239 (+) Transcript_27266:41-757(+)